MTNELRLRAFAGIMILISVALVFFVSPWWLLFTAFIGANLLQSAFTGFCPPLWVMRKLWPEPPPHASDSPSVGPHTSSP